MASIMASVLASSAPSLATPASPKSLASPPTSVNEFEDLEKTIFTINDLLRTRANGPTGNDDIVAYPSNGTKYTYYTPAQLDKFVEAAGVHYARTIPQRRSSDDPVQVVGLLGASDLEYLITLLAISRLGHTVLFLSTRIAEDAYVSLIENTKATFLITYSNFQTVGEKVTNRTGTTQVPVLSSGDYASFSGTLPPANLDGPRENKQITWIIHSSGSTGHPKPIYQTHAGALKNYANNFGLRGFITLPLFHAHGISCLFRALHSQKLIYMYNANLPLTAPFLLTTLKEHLEIQVLYGVPYALKLLSESGDGLRMMSRLELVMFGGSSCPKPIGDKLVQNGVRLVSHYGTTETGQLMTSFRERSDLDWDYVRPGLSLLPYLRWEEQMAGIYELCILEGWPSKVASNRPDNSYATSDLFEQHPTKPNAWRYYARLDDTLVLENGEKVNPLVIEGVARNNANISEAIAFGAGKPRLGLFLVPADGFQGTEDDLVETVFPDIEKCNKEMPAYAYISRDMIHVLRKDAVYRKTDKGTVIRSAFYRDFADQITQIYDIDLAQGDQIMEGTELTSFLREKLLDIVSFIDPSSLSDITDLFSLGVDSLQTTRLRAEVLKTLNIGGASLSQNFVFENPSLSAMTDELTRLHPCPHPHEYDGEHVVLTGATGSLGAHIAAQLARSDNIRTVYCLVRASSAFSARQRVAQSLHERAVSFDLSPAAMRKLVPLPADLANSTRFGLDETTYDQLLNSTTAVMHCAWAVNFNWSLESFEDSCIAGARNLLDFCLSTKSPRPASMSFCSSVSTVAQTPGNWVPEELPESLSYAQGMGYAQSKLVTEHIINRAAHQTGMTARVLRVGQIIADTSHGIWNATEAIPMIFRTAETIKALPQLDEILSWTPVDVIASSIIDITFAPDAAEVINVTNPILNHWTRDLLPLLEQAGLEFEQLSKREWINRLRGSDQDPNSNPPIKLFEFFASKYDNDRSGRVLLYDTKKAQAVAPALRSAGGLDASFVSEFIRYFRTKCWIPSSKTQSQQPRHVVFLIGPCGCGKSTVAKALTEQLEIPNIEGDDLHSPSTRSKMAKNLPLHDIDRWDWLAHIRGAIMDRLQHTSAPLISVTCSALRTAYRDELRKLSTLFDFPVTISFILLGISDKAQLEERVVARFDAEGHYMKSAMVDSQLGILEYPDNEYDITVIDSSQPRAKMVEDVVNNVLDMLHT
ncbi:acetyl-CoA synthetase-like protein [Penicillium lividum]|nr:acetyl-CoA synthetase-like protein [Penicillium lividum]